MVFNCCLWFVFVCLFIMYICMCVCVKRKMECSHLLQKQELNWRWCCSCITYKKNGLRRSLQIRPFFNVFKKYTQLDSKLPLPTLKVCECGARLFVTIQKMEQEKNLLMIFGWKSEIDNIVSDDLRILFDGTRSWIPRVDQSERDSLEPPPLLTRSHRTESDVWFFCTI